MKFNEFIKLYYSGDVKIIYFNEIKTKMYWVLHDGKPIEKVNYEVTYFYGYRYHKCSDGRNKIHKTYRNITMNLPEWFVNKLKFNPIKYSLDEL